MTWGSLQDIYLTKLKLRLYPSTPFVSMIYIWFIFDQIWHFYGTQICIRNVPFHDLLISVKYLTQNMPNGKICCKYIWYENRWWYMLQILSLFLSKYAVSIFIFYFITYMHTLYMTRRCILHPYLIRYGWCQQNLKYASEMVSILKQIHCKDMPLGHIWINIWHIKYSRKNIVIRYLQIWPKVIYGTYIWQK